MPVLLDNTETLLDVARRVNALHKQIEVELLDALGEDFERYEEEFGLTGRTLQISTDLAAYRSRLMQVVARHKAHCALH